MERQYASNSNPEKITTLGTFSEHVAVPLYAIGWILMWLVGTMLEYTVFVYDSVVNKRPIYRRYFEICLAMPVFALFCVALWVSVKCMVKCVEGSVDFLYSLSTEDDPKSVIRDYEEHVLRRRLRAGRPY